MMPEWRVQIQRASRSRGKLYVWLKQQLEEDTRQHPARVGMQSAKYGHFRTTALSSVVDVRIALDIDICVLSLFGSPSEWQRHAIYSATDDEVG